MTISLFDYAASCTAKAEALASVEAHNAAWVEAALEAVYRVALRHETFTTDEVWKVLIDKPHEGRAMGAVMRRAKAKGWIVPTSTFVATEKVSQHAQPLRQWRSAIWRS